MYTEEQLKAALSKIKAFAFDVDGIMTDGGIIAINQDLLRVYNAKDCFALRMASMKGYPMAIITGGISKIIEQRFIGHCGFKEGDVYLRSRNKMDHFDDFCRKYNLSYDEILYCGDDLPDIGPLCAAGIGACPSDSVPEVLAAADYVAPLKGGQCFVRHIVELVMRSQGTWTLDVDQYKREF